MRLRTFYVKNYRSITKASLEDIRKYCVIVGPNNAGKSNLLKALIVALSLALEGNFQTAIRNRRYSYIYEGENYDWNRDIPKKLVDNENASTIFKLTFEFSEEEKAEFKKELGINLTKSLQMQFVISKSNTEYNIIMPGRAKKPMEAKMREIALFIQSKLDYQYIPCVRTSEFTSEYFSRLLSKELRRLDNNDEYKGYIQKMKMLQEPIIKELELRLTTALKTFLPQINNVIINDLMFSNEKIYSTNQFRIRRQTTISIDDGDCTLLDDKGDGVKSLAAIGLVQSLTFENAGNKSLILCIEEPEAHLHPDAVHSLKNIILELANRNGVQVVISTHSPLLVDRGYLPNNVIINENHVVTPCNALSVIRELLGVRLHDNLRNVERVVLVEGISDKRYLEKLCSDKIPELKQKIESEILMFINVNSASKMEFQIRLFNSLMIPSIVIFDNDSAGIDAGNNLISKKIKQPNEVLYIKSIGMTRNELEDIVEFNCYFEVIFNKFNIKLNTPEFKQKRSPWSDRLKKACETSPCDYSDQLEEGIKTELANIVAQNGFEAIAEYNKKLVYSLIDIIAKFAGIDDIS